MILQNYPQTVDDKRKRCDEIVIIGDNQEKLLTIKNLLETLDMPIYLFLVGESIFKKNIDAEIIFLENISKIEEYFPSDNKRIYLACFA